MHGTMAWLGHFLVGAGDIRTKAILQEAFATPAQHGITTADTVLCAHTAAVETGCYLQTHKKRVW